MRAYPAILASRFQTMLQYRAVAAAGVVTQLFWGFVRTMIYDAFYSGSAGSQPLSHTQAITYIWLGQAMLLLTILNAESDVASMIRTGSIAYEMTRPLDLYSVWFVRAFSGRAAPLIMRAIPILAIAGLFFGLAAPVSATAGALFLISAVVGLLTAAALIAIMTATLLWTISGEGISRLAPGLIFVFSGIVVPLPLLPQWVQSVAEALPFRGLIDTPFRIYIGELHGSSELVALFLQFSWLLVLILLGKVLVGRGTRRLVVQGG